MRRCLQKVKKFHIYYGTKRFIAVFVVSVPCIIVFSTILTNQQANKKNAYSFYVIHNNINFKLLHLLDLTGPSLGSTLIVVV